MSRISDVLNQWKEAAAEGRIPAVAAIWGESDTVLKRGLEILKDTLFAGGGSDLNYHRYDAKSSKPSQWLVAARTAPMLAGARLVHVTDSEGCFKKDGGLPPETLEALDAFHTRSRKGRIIFTARELDRRSPLASWLDSINGLFCFESFDNRQDVDAFISQMFRKRGVSINGAAVSFLAEALGRSAEAIISEVDKLSEYAKDKGSVTLADAESMVKRLEGHKIYELSRAIVRKDAVAALTILDRMYRNLLDSNRKVSTAGIPLLVLSSCVESEFRMMAIAKEFQESNDAAAFATRMTSLQGGRGKFKEARARIIISNARRFSVREIESALSRARQVDKRLKSTSLPSKLLLEELILAICRGGRR